MENYILSIDQGTTSTRAIIFDKQANTVAIAQEEITQYFPKPGWVEQDANEIWLKTLAVLAKVLAIGNIQPSQIAAIGITNQRETTVVWDSRTGLPIHRAIVWQSRQSDAICQKLIKDGYSEMVKSKTGLPIDAYFSATKIRWILDKYPDIDVNDLMFGTIDTWLLWKLSGDKVHATDVTNASRTMLYNIHQMQWDEELLHLLNIPQSMLPTVHDSSYQFGTTASYHFFNHQVPITSLIGDQQSALFGQCCFEKGMVKNTYGTGGFLLMNTGDEIVNSKYGLVSTIGWRLNGKVTYALEGSIFVAGSLIQWLRDGLGIVEHASDTEKLALSVDDNNGVYIVPAFVGLGAPYWDDNCKGSILGLTRGVTKAHIARAALEAMCYQSKDLIDAMQKDLGLKIPLLRVDGGASENKFLLQFQSDLLQIPIENLKSKETTALGAAYLAGLNIGYYKMDDFVPAINLKVNPNNNSAIMDEYYKGWIKAVDATRRF